MDFGRTVRAEAADFRLPELNEQSQGAVLPRLLTGVRGSVRVGAPIWGFAPWVGSFYPPRTPAQRFLKTYAERLPTVEVNSTFYGIPTVLQVERWSEQVPSSFRFCPKVSQVISHDRRLRGVEREWARFLEAWHPVREKLGMIFLQLPPYFAADELVHLTRFFRSTPPWVPLAVEFRHPSWFGPGGRLQPEVYDALVMHEVTAVMVDVAGRRDALHVALTSSRVMLRFAANEGHVTDGERTAMWAPRLKLWAEQGYDVYAFVHQPDERYGPPLIRTWMSQLGEGDSPETEVVEARQLSLF